MEGAHSRSVGDAEAGELGEGRVVRLDGAVRLRMRVGTLTGLA